MWSFTSRDSLTPVSSVTKHSGLEMFYVVIHIEIILYIFQKKKWPQTTHCKISFISFQVKTEFENAYWAMQITSQIVQINFWFSYNFFQNLFRWNNKHQRPERVEIKLTLKLLYRYIVVWYHQLKDILLYDQRSQ